MVSDFNINDKDNVAIINHEHSNSIDENTSHLIKKNVSDSIEKKRLSNKELDSSIKNIEPIPLSNCLNSSDYGSIISDKNKSFDEVHLCEENLRKTMTKISLTCSLKGKFI